ncbi:MAG TPA: Ig-like domain-containing protein, partial [Steroidobacteraceae bacterium]|nr:Ig-like domain-containing protein [Steroidobacteraceae bacterium]
MAAFVGRSMRDCSAAVLLAAGALFSLARTAHAQSAVSLSLSAPPQLSVSNPPSGPFTFPVVVTSSGNVLSSLTWTQSAATAGGGTLTYQSSGSDCPAVVDGLTLNCTLMYEYTPGPNFFGNDSFAVAVNAPDISASATATVAATVFPSQLSANSFTTSTTVATPLTVDLLAGGDIRCNNLDCGSGLQFTVSVVSGPAQGTATVSGTTITYTPSPGFTGSDSLVYQVSDSQDQVASGTMTVTVAQPSVTVPTDLVGKTQAAGTAELSAAGFVVTVGQTYSTSVPAGEIAASQPAPGTTALRGSTVKLLVSRGPGAVAGGPLSSQPGLTPEQVSTARGVERTCG